MHANPPPEKDSDAMDVWPREANVKMVDGPDSVGRVNFSCLW
jgi:hypothetical protein